GLVQKASGEVLAGSEGSATPFFEDTSATVTDLNLAQGSSPNLSFGSVEAADRTITASAEEFASPTMAMSAPSSSGDADTTLVMGDVPNFSLPTLAPAPTPPPDSTTPAAGGPSPLKIIPPPKAAERTRPPAKPSKQDLAALDELLGKKSPEGPLTPI